MADMLKMISTIYRKTQMYLNERLAPYGLTAGQATFIMCICSHGSLTQNRLCEMLDMDKSTVAKSLSRLEEEGYIVRAENPSDSRSLQVSPTDKALAIYPIAEQIGQDWHAELARGLTRIETDIFTQLMEKANDNAVEYFKL